MYTQMSRILRAVIPALLLSAAVALGASTDFVDVTVQGRLTDAAGNSLPDGTYDIGVDRIRQDGAVFSSGVFPVQVTGGLFNLTVEDIPAAFFDCPNPNLPCEQKLQLALVDLGILLPLIKIGGVGRAALASGLDGHVKTSPRQLEILAADPLTNAGKAVFTDVSITLVDAAGNPIFEVNTETYTLNVGAGMYTSLLGDVQMGPPGAYQGGWVYYPVVKEFHGEGTGFSINNTGNILNDFEIGLDGSLRISFDGISGIDASLTATGIDFAKETRFTGNVLCNPGGIGGNNFEVLANAVNSNVPINVDLVPGGAKNLEVTDGLVTIDVDGDGVNEVRVLGDGVTLRNNTSFDPAGNGSPTITFVSGLVSIYEPLHIDANNDGTPELTITGGLTPSITFAGNVHVTGNLSAGGNKPFVQQHPNDPTKEIVYVSLEGGETGTYTRGSSKLENGVVTVELPEHFALVTNAESLTAQITPRGPVQSMLYVESVTPSQLVVKASNPADADVPFDFMINGVRTGFEDHQVFRDKQVLAATR